MFWFALACTDRAAPGHTGADSETGTTPLDTASTAPSGERVLVVPGGDGLDLFDETGTSVWSATWSDLVGSCTTCGGEGASPDDDGGLLLAFTTVGQNTGAVARLDASLALDFRVDGFAFPHDVIRDPSDGSLVVAETSANQLRWIDGQGASADATRTLGPAEGFDGMPNGLTRFDHAGHTYALVTHRGTGPSGGSGSIELWDITTPGAAALSWRFPSTGELDTPHCPDLQQVDGQWWLTWAHTQGGSSGGSVGLAVTADPTVRPEYVADLLPPTDLAPFAFLRGVELDAAGALWIVDSGVLGPPGAGGASGRLFTAALPALDPTGASGAVDSDQIFATMDDLALLADGLSNPFEGWWWTR